jgi:GR25 family glycosyltransferase involved in LPS biosynthesis
MMDLQLDRFGPKITNTCRLTGAAHAYLNNVLCINLDIATERLAKLDEELRIQWVNWHRLEAFDTHNDTSINNVWNQPGHVGVARSHRECIKYAKHFEWPHVTIFEDDVKFIGDLQSQFTEYIKYVPDDWDFLFLGGIRHLAAPIYVNEHIVKTTATFGMISYVVRNTLYDELIERWSDEGIKDGNGNFVSTEVSMHPIQPVKNFYAMYPSMVWQDRFNYSYIARSSELGDITDNIGNFIKQDCSGALIN